MTAAAAVRPCRVAGCTRMGRIVGRRATSRDVCSMHAMRKRRYGSFTARRCWGCGEIVDDDGSQKTGGSFYCDTCLVDRTLCVYRNCENVARSGELYCTRHWGHDAKGRKVRAAARAREQRLARKRKTRARARRVVRPRQPARRRCAAYDCQRGLGRERIAFCVRHWRMLSPAIKERVHAAHCQGSDAEWLDAVTDAKEWIRGGA